LAEDSYLLREGMQLLFATQTDMELVGRYGDLDELLEAVERELPDVVLTDIRMPPTNTDEGIQAAQLLRERHPGLGVVVLSQFAEPTYARKLFLGGAERRAYLLKERVGDVETLFDAVRTVHAGGSVLDPKIVELLVGSAATAGSSLSRLSTREHDVLAEMAKGKSNNGIARALFITERAVEKHINAMFSKLDLVEETETNRRVTAVRLFLGVDQV
jgi:DNA-binding NarL/FixJ family response regulator